MLFKPNDWKFYPDELANHSDDKERVIAISTVLQEIESLGYEVRKRKRDKEGYFKGSDYLLYETPQKTIRIPKTGTPINRMPVRKIPVMACCLILIYQILTNR